MAPTPGQSGLPRAPCARRWRQESLFDPRAARKGVHGLTEMPVRGSAGGAHKRFWLVCRLDCDTQDTSHPQGAAFHGLPTEMRRVQVGQVLTVSAARAGHCKTHGLQDFRAPPPRLGRAGPG